MWRILLCLLTLLLVPASQASSAFSLERRLLSLDPQQSPSLTLEQWQEQHKNVQQQTDQLRQQMQQFEQRKAQLHRQLNEPLPAGVDNDQPISQQQSWIHSQLQELKSSAESLRQLQQQVRLRLSQLPEIEESAHQQLVLAQGMSDQDGLASARQAYFSALLTLMQLEHQSLPQDLELISLRQRLVQSQQTSLELKLTQLNRRAEAERRKQSETALRENPARAPERERDPRLSRLSEENAHLARSLAKLNGQIESISQSLLQAEQRYKSQSSELNETREQLEWGDASARFGSTLIRRLNQLERQPEGIDTTSALSNSRLQRYDYERQLEQLQRGMDDPSEVTHELHQRQQELLIQLIEGHERLVVELTRLKLQQQELATLQSNFKQLITEYLFWLPNAPVLSADTLKNFSLSLSWLTDPKRFEELSQAMQSQQAAWSWWLLLLVLMIVLLDLLQRPYQQRRKRHAQYIGNVTRDRFSDSLRALLLALLFGLLPMLPLWLAGAIWLHNEEFAFANALGQGVLALSLVLQLYLWVRLLTHPEGLLVAHFRRHPPLVAKLNKLLFKVHLIAAPLMALLAITEALDLPLLTTSLGRISFILLCLLTSYSFRRLAALSREYHEHHSKTDINQRMLERLIWLTLFVVPLIALVLAWRGYYYSAQQLLGQAQITVTAAIAFLLIYLMIKRWMLIERRRLQFELAKARRAEVLAMREREKSEGQGSTSAEGQLDFDDSQLDLDTISSQSLGLIRSLMFLSFAMTLLALWSQTHPAMFSFLDGITLYSSGQMVGGIEQAVPITLKSLVTALVIGAFTWMIARNLPGLLELMLLQRLELSPGTGFAVSTVSKYLVYMIGIVAVFSTLGLAWSKMQWLIAALTVGLGFGLQEIFANFISGLIILFEKPIRIGDTVTIRDLSGTVSKIQIRATTIVDWDRKEIIVPNKAFITEQLVNWSLSDAITRVILKVSVARDSDPALVEAALHQAVQESPHSLSQPEPEIYFGGFGTHTQDFEVRAYADEMGKRWPLRHDLHMRITAKFREKGIVLAYPQMDLHLAPQEIKESGLVRN
ncbi:mechanosensitive ion channel domain-containing protein [Ferrimonas gelatinilytica]|uniref:Mechanosensitive ion channel n=1 Tax=Ferrimonas gelatinilytica TaxID=1255257 RepID=A0ABP9S6N3_9GAMM